MRAIVLVSSHDPVPPIVEIRVLRENIEAAAQEVSQSLNSRAASRSGSLQSFHTRSLLSWTVFVDHGNAQDRRLQHRQGIWRRKGLVWDLVLDGDEYGVVTLDGAVEEDD